MASTGLYLKGFKLKTREKDASGNIAVVEKDGFAFFEASSAARIICKLYNIALVPKVADTHEGSYTRKSYWSRKKDSSGAVQIDQVKADLKIFYKRTSPPQSKRGKIITLYTGLYGKPPAKGVWLPKSFSFRYPSWLNNSFALDFAAEYFGTKADDTATNEQKLLPIIRLGKTPYRFPNKSRVTSESATPGEIENIKEANAAETPAPTKETK